MPLLNLARNFLTASIQRQRGSKTYFGSSKAVFEPSFFFLKRTLYPSSTDIIFTPPVLVSVAYHACSAEVFMRWKASAKPILSTGPWRERGRKCSTRKASAEFPVWPQYAPWAANDMFHLLHWP